MSDIVPVRHPAPIRHVPRGMRNDRLSFAACTTPARLREAAPADLEPVGTLATWHHGERLVHRAVRHGGRLWVPVPGHDGIPLPRADFLAFLEGRLPRPDAVASQLEHAFAGTPLLSFPAVSNARGGEVDPARSRRLLHDLTEPARAALLRFLDEEVLLAGNEALVRVAGPVLVQTAALWDTDGGERFDLDLFPRHGVRAHHWTTWCGAARLADLHAFRLRHGLSDAPIPYARDLPDPVPSLLDTDDDLPLHATRLAKAVLDSLWHVRAALPPDGAIAAGEAELRRFDDLATVGAVHPAETEGLLLKVRSLVRGCLDEIPFCRQAWDRNAALIPAYIDEALLPRLRTPALSAEDADALSDLEPGGFAP